MKQYLSNFDSTTLTCDPTVFPGKIIPNIAKSNRIFPGKEGVGKDFILTYFYSSMADVFPDYCLFFSILTIFGRKRGLKVGPKVLTLGPTLFHLYSNPSKHFQTVFYFARVLPLVKILSILKPIGGVRAQKPTKKGYFVDAKSVRKTLEVFNLAIENTVLMELTTIMFLHESINQKALRVRNSFFFHSFLNLIVSLMKLLYKLGNILGNIP